MIADKTRMSNLPPGLSTTDPRSPLFNGCHECGDPHAEKSPCEPCHEEHYEQEAARRAGPTYDQKDDN